MQVVGGHIYLEYQELREMGIPKGTVDSGLNLYRRGSSASWENMDDPTDRRRVLIRFASIPTPTRAKYQLPTEEELLARIREEAAAREHRKQQVEAAGVKANVFKAKTEGYARYMPEYAQPHTAPDGTAHPGYPLETARQLAQAAAVLAVGVELTTSGATRKAPQLLAEYLDAIRAADLRYLRISNLRYLREKLQMARERGLLATIRPAREGSTNAKKTDEKHEYLAELYYSLPACLTEYGVWQRVAAKCESNGLYVPSESWVKQHLRKPEVQNACAASRYGEAHYNAKVGGYTDRKMAWFPGDCWMEDGTKLMLAYLDSNGRPAAKWIYVVLDVYSGYIAGYALGDTEDRHLRMAALEMAVKRAGFAPALLARDNHAHSKTEEVQRMEAALAKAGTLVYPAPVGQPQFKSQIERFFGTFQSVTLRGADNYLGEGIRSKRKNARPSPEFIARMARERRLPNEDALELQVRDLVNIHNQARYRGQPSASELFAEEFRPHAKPFGPELSAYAFWPARTVTMRRSELVLTIRGQEHKYYLSRTATGEPQVEALARLNGTPVTVHYDPADPASTIFLFHPETGMPIGEAKPKVRVNGNPALMTEEDHKKIAEQQAIQEAQRRHQEQRASNLRNRAESLGLETAGLEELADYRTLNKELLDTAESRSLATYLWQEGAPTEAEAREGALVPIPVGEQTPYARTPAPLNRNRRGLYDREGSLQVIEN